MDKVRIGIVGLGNIGQIHAKSLLDGNVERGELTAVADAFPDKLKQYEEQGVKVYGDADALITSGEIDALMIATPHFQHTTLGIAALDAGLHIMVEKPISAHKADAERLVAKAKEKPDQVFGGMFQLRIEPRYEKIRELVQGGELGDLDARSLDHDRLVPFRGLLSKWWLASHLERGGRWGIAQPSAFTN